ncbi:diamine acetyltransferase 2-like isoform X4 [Alligator sinensis]|uniref:Diamine acetyltransferase 2-like isoform X4 n=1 Tax=Alligator sinensis TaxID=38654 RepID=A0A3Q0FUF0_ALLSI|nr:diamine acetyltransferase 2-like isoform X4 [Alligator sinensis]
MNPARRPWRPGGAGLSPSVCMYGIAEHHQLRHQVTIGAQDLQADGFGPNPFYHCLLAELLPRPGELPGPPVGYALFFFGYSVNHGRLVYLENLYVEAPYRGHPAQPNNSTQQKPTQPSKATGGQISPDVPHGDDGEGPRHWEDTAE